MENNKNEFDPGNVKTWNGRWHCPFCNAPVGSPVCSCGTSWMLVDDDDMPHQLLVFFEAGTMRPFKSSAKGRPFLEAGVVKKIFFVSKEEGRILGEAAKKDVFQAASIKRKATDSFSG